MQSGETWLKTVKLAYSGELALGEFCCLNDNSAFIAQRVVVVETTDVLPINLHSYD